MSPHIVAIFEKVVRQGAKVLIQRGNTGVEQISLAQPEMTAAQALTGYALPSWVQMLLGLGKLKGNGSSS